MNVLDPQGPVGAAQKIIFLNSLGIMLAIVVPTIVAVFAFAFWFRQSNSRARHLPDWAYSGRIELMVWSIPALTVFLLGGVTWIGAHDLDPRKPIAGTGEQLTVQVVSLDWRWLFIYPDQRVATINTLTIPQGTPLRLEITSSSVMNAFFIPQLGSMIYAMNGMTTQLHLRADRIGRYQGLSAQFSGDGFPNMVFDVDVVSPADFSAWAAAAADSPLALNAGTYKAIMMPTMATERITYRLEDPALFHAIATQMLPPAPGWKAAY